MRRGSVGAAIAEALGLAHAFALPAAALAESLAFDETAVRAALAAAPTTIGLADGSGDEMFTTTAKWDVVREAVRETVARFHDQHPLASGLEMEAVRTQLPYAVGAKLFRAVVERLAGERIVERRESLLVAPDHHVALAEAYRAVADRARAALTAAGLTPPDIKTLATTVTSSGSRTRARGTTIHSTIHSHRARLRRSSIGMEIGYSLTTT